MVAAMFDTFDHVLLAVRDLDAATSAYRTVMGLEPSWRGEHPGLGTANVLFRVDNTYLELIAPRGEGPIGSFLGGWIDDRGEGLMGFALGTPDIEACHRGLEEAGLEPSPVEGDRGREIDTGAERRWRRASLPTSRTRGVVVFPIQHESPADTLPRARPVADARAAVHALDHVVVQTSDADATRRLYGDALGLRLALDKRFPDWGVQLMFFRVGGTTIEVAAPLPGGGEAAGALASGTPGAGQDRVWGMSWRVGDIDAARARLSDAGVDVSEVRKGRRPGTRVISVRSSTCGVPTLMLEVEGGNA